MNTTLHLLRTSGALLAGACALAFAAPPAFADHTPATDCDPTLVDGAGVAYELNRNADVGDHDNGFGHYGQLRLREASDDFDTSFFDQDGECQQQNDGREIVFRQTEDAGGLEIIRRLYVSNTGEPFIRWRDTITNTNSAGDDPIAFEMDFDGHFHSHSDTYLGSTSSGDNEFARPDRWFTTGDADEFNSSPRHRGKKTANVLDAEPASPDRYDRVNDSPGGADTSGNDDFSGSDGMSVTYEGLSLAPGQSMTYMHLSRANASDEDEIGASMAEMNRSAADLSVAPSDVYAGMSDADRGLLRNFPFDGDGDRDGVLNRQDNCDRVSNADQADLDGDGQGDVCDADIDGDGLSNSAEAETGTDPRKADTDGDGRSDRDDACPKVAGNTGDGCTTNNITTVQQIVASQQGPVQRLRARGLSAKSRKSRTRRSVKVATSGRLLLPAGLTAAQGCTRGIVQVQVKSGTRTVSTRRSALRPDCTFVSSVTFAGRSRLGQRQMKVIAMFLGNDRLFRQRAKTLSIGRP